MRPRLVVNTAQAAIDAAVAGLGSCACCRTRSRGRWPTKKLRLVLESAPRRLPVQIVQLPGIPNRLAGAFLDFAADRLRARLRTR